MATNRPSPLYRIHEPTFRTQYTEVKERSLAAGALLPGTPGQLVHHEVGGRGYWYRRYYPVQGGKPVDDFVCKEDDVTARVAFKDKAQKDLLQAATLAAVLVEQDDARLGDSLAAAPAELRAAAQSRLPALRALLARHPQTLEAIEDALAERG